MKKLNEFTPDSVWYIGSTKRTLKEWCRIYAMDFGLVQDRMKYGNTLHRALTKKTPVERSRPTIKTLEELKAEFSQPKPYIFDKDYERGLPEQNIANCILERSRAAFNLMYGKDNINQLTQY